MSVRAFFRRPRAVDARQAQELIAAGAVVVDVRRRADWARNRIPNSVNIPLAQLEERADELPDDRLIIAFCTGGLLSSGAANMLSELGFDACHLGRGLVEWRGAGGELEHDD